jgi:uncharacterized membrane protein YgdD (TMEM256/DUF423 family)
MQLFIFIGSLNAFLAVALGAFGAHGLKSRVTTEMLAVWQTGVQYHLYHALGLILVGVLLHLFPQASQLKLAGWLLVAGIVLFSGSLYLLTLSGVRVLGAITPLGGVAFLLGWLLVALFAWKN